MRSEEIVYESESSTDRSVPEVYTDVLETAAVEDPAGVDKQSDVGGVDDSGKGNEDEEFAGADGEEGEEKTVKNLWVTS